MATIHNYFVYILECIDKSYYVGVTNDLDIRIQQHTNGENISSYTFTLRPVVLKYYKRFGQIGHAIEFDKQVKGWSRKKKEALFSEDWDEIVRLSNLKKEE
ncbi:GIY-YIG nuclease family protein [Pedobacter mendelii]|uniref:GIY-YIG domain-containing protein n=1 Tax=Pedobacter mendelii TaxID=1908240 RepID=A0ABQ2BJL3_9SPHI|nr:GIY-YIG nuclease family protein [Pedobacter mendelii]GGI27453.1 GIY-YIG domain-containing protein [Pedobacter mendelii]